MNLIIITQKFCVDHWVWISLIFWCIFSNLENRPTFSLVSNAKALDFCWLKGSNFASPNLVSTNRKAVSSPSLSCKNVPSVTGTLPISSSRPFVPLWRPCKNHVTKHQLLTHILMKQENKPRGQKMPLAERRWDRAEFLLLGKFLVAIKNCHEIHVKIIQFPW